MKSLLEIISGSNIAKDDFTTYVDSCMIVDLSKLNDYYNEKKEHADQLVIEDEFVGKTYHNLEVISNIIVKRRSK